jgi:hypothetical protein
MDSKRTTKNYPAVEEGYILNYCNPEYLHKSRAISPPVSSKREIGFDLKEKQARYGRKGSVLLDGKEN